MKRGVVVKAWAICLDGKLSGLCHFLEYDHKGEGMNTLRASIYLDEESAIKTAKECDPKDRLVVPVLITLPLKTRGRAK